LLNPNEPEARLAFLAIREGQQVAKDDVLATLETTKSTADLPAEADGFIAGLQHREGDRVRAGERLCYLAESPDWRPAESEPAPDFEASAGRSAGLPEGLRITKPALALANRSGVNLELLPVGPLITEQIVRDHLAKHEAISSPEGAFDPTSIIIFGGGGHGKMMIDFIRRLGGYQITGIVDDGMATHKTQKSGPEVMGVPVLGGSEQLARLYQQGVRFAANAVGGIGNLSVRVQIFQRLEEAGFACPALIHPKAFVETSARISAGAQVFPLAYVGSEARIGYGVIVNTNVIVSHDCVIGNYSNLSPGALLAGEVTVGDEVLIGMGVTINLQVKVGDRARIGNGATVKADVPEGGIVRAGSIWPGD
jgi:sugar O-acyltransferase (sialic acid O-acetyltransferase NeuD family)